MSSAGTLALIIGAYLLGSIPFGLLIARWSAGVDVRSIGSGNIGATNVGRAAGKKMGALALALDLLKAALPTGLGLALAPGDPTLAAGAGLAAFLGHCFPVFLRGRGGKGVSCALGVLLVLSPASVAIGGGVFVAIYGLTRRVSLGSMTGSIASSAALWLLHAPEVEALAGSAMTGIILWRHGSNIGRLLKGTEPPT